VNAIFKRELRRLMPLGLCLPALVLVLAAWIDADNSLLGMNLDGVLVLSLMAIPAVLAVGTIAPDTGSGGIAFLSRLPLSPARTILPKAFAAFAWSAFVWGTILFAWSGLLDTPGGLWREAGIAAFLFASGLLASVIARRTMAAVLLAPMIALFVAIVALGIPSLALRFQWAKPQSDAVLDALGAALVLVAFLAFTRGDKHRVSARPALLAASGLVLALGLSISATTYAHGVSVANAALEIPVEARAGVVSPDGHSVAFVLRGDRWTGTETRVALLGRNDDSSWIVPARNGDSPQFSPDGRWLLLDSSRDVGGFLVDLATRRVERLDAPPRGVRFEWLGSPHVLWRESGPVILRHFNGALELYDPRTHLESAAAVPKGYGLLAARDGRVLLYDAAGIARVTPPLPGEAERPLEPERLYEVPEGTGVFEAVVSVSGKHVLVRRVQGKSASFDLLDLTGPVRVLRGAVADAADQEMFGPGCFSPSERRLMLGSNAGASFFAVEPEALRPLATIPRGELRPGLRDWIPVVWSADERTVAVSWGDVLDLESGKLVTHPSVTVAAFLEPGRVVAARHTLAVRSLETGAVLSRPLVRH
jgi:hypothetical protein